MLKQHFRQAAEGISPSVLKKIRRAEINLAVWHDPLSPESKAYLAGLDPQQLAGGRPWRDGYFTDIGRLKASTTKQARAKAVAGLLENLPAGKGRDALARDVEKLVVAFTRAVNGKNITGSLLVFKPTKDGGGFWHADSDNQRGIITLKGDKGTLWAPDDAPLKKEDKKGVYWGKVKPVKHTFMQEMKPQDFAVFKCLPFPNPLRHATPPPPLSSEYRLTFIMGSH